MAKLNPNEVDWTCPGCNRRFAIRANMSPTLCPDCRKTRATPPPIIVAAPPASSRSRGRSSLPLIISGVAVAALIAIGVMFWSGKSPTSMVLGDPDKNLVNAWLKENLNSGKWEEVKWWAAVDYGDKAKELMAATQKTIAQQNSDVQPHEVLFWEIRAKMDALVPGISEKRMASEKASKRATSAGIEGLINKPGRREASISFEKESIKLEEEAKQLERDYEALGAEIVRCDALRSPRLERLRKSTDALDELKLIPAGKRIARLKYRTDGPFGTKTLVDQLFFLDDGKVSSTEIYSSDNCDRFLKYLPQVAKAMGMNQ